MFKLPKKVINDIDYYREKLERFLSGTITDAFFRGVRVPWGFYSQRGGKILMSRLRIPAGILNLNQLKAIGEAALKFADGKLHITTRQDIQIHNVPFENSIKIIEYLKDYNISPRGGGGNTVRNITACYLSGICPYENFEVYKLNWGLTEYLLTLDESYNLPRKFKIAFSGCEKDCAFTGVNDIGIVALNNNRFKVLCGGGMGAKSSVGKILIDNAKIEEIGYIVKSVMNVFNKYGDRKNRHHNRLRFLIEDLKWEKFIKLFNEELNRLKTEEYIYLNIDKSLPDLQELNEEEIKFNNDDFFKYNVGFQKQKGYFYIQLRIKCGEISGENLIKLSRICENFPQTIFRTTPRQNLIISNIPEKAINSIYNQIKDIFSDFLYPDTIYDIVSCKSVSTCNLGICNAISLAPEIEKKLKKLNLNLEKLKDVKININGCPNACGQHPIGSIGLSGLARKVYNKTVPFYKIHFGAKIDAENTKLAEEVGIIPAKNVPEFISDAVLYIQDNKENTLEFLKSLISKYGYIPAYEENRDYYIDFGKNEDFSLEGLSSGECGAGVIDMIEADLQSAKQSLIKAKEKNYDTEEIKNSIIFSARALLVVRGLDPKNEIEVIDGFISKFIGTGIAKKEFSNLKEKYNSIKNGIDDYNFAYSFYEEIRRIYSIMDSNFNFPVTIDDSKKEIEKKEEVSVYDLRGTPCPINYVKTKLKLEEMKVNEILEIYLDDGEPIRNVPESLKKDGQQILSITKENNFYKVKIMKKV